MIKVSSQQNFWHWCSVKLLFQLLITYMYRAFLHLLSTNIHFLQRTAIEDVSLTIPTSMASLSQQALFVQNTIVKLRSFIKMKLIWLQNTVSYFFVIHLSWDKITRKNSPIFVSEVSFAALWKKKKQQQKAHKFR